MSISFPNRARSYDETRDQIRFSGYDGMMEIRFLVELDALAKALSAKVSGEPDGLAAFGKLRQRVLETAEKVYAKRKGLKTYMLTSADF